MRYPTLTSTLHLYTFAYMLTCLCCLNIIALFLLYFLVACAAVKSPLTALSLSLSYTTPLTRKKRTEASP
jgi:hypothetical protein